jgi:hypothetical protein
LRRLPGCVLLAILALAMPCLGLAPYVWFAIDGHMERHYVIHHADHKAILAACRELMEKCPDDTPWDPMRDGGSLPEAILALKPVDIDVTKEYVGIELHGGHVHYGVIAYAKGTEKGGTKKLIDGLWYYED